MRPLHSLGFSMKPIITYVGLKEKNDPPSIEAPLSSRQWVLCTPLVHPCTPCNYETFRIWQDTLAYRNCKCCFCSHIQEATFLFFEASIVWMVEQGLWLGYAGYTSINCQTTSENETQLLLKSHEI